MENEITAHKAGTIAELPIKEGAPIAAGDHDRRHHLERLVTSSGKVPAARRLQEQGDARSAAADPAPLGRRCSEPAGRARRLTRRRRGPAAAAARARCAGCISPVSSS